MQRGSIHVISIDPGTKRTMAILSSLLGSYLESLLLPTLQVASGFVSPCNVSHASSSSLFKEVVILIGDRIKVACNQTTTAARLVQRASKLLELFRAVRERIARLEVYVYDAEEGVLCVRGDEVHVKSFPTSCTWKLLAKNLPNNELSFIL